MACSPQSCMWYPTGLLLSYQRSTVEAQIPPSVHVVLNHQQPDKEGDLLHAVAFSRDITRRRKTEHQLESALESREQLLTVLSPDLYPLSQVLLGYGQTLSEELEQLGVVEVRDCSYEIDSSTVKANDLLNNLIEWSESRTSDLDFEPKKY